jgi:SAM-dependent methyltransferase
MKNKLRSILEIRFLPFYIKDFLTLKRQKNSDKSFYFGEFYPILKERFSDAGTMSGQYFHQDLLVAKKIFNGNPKKHIDIGSRIDGFVAHVAVFREIEIVDIRPEKSTVDNITFIQLDLMKLPENLVDSYDSVSSLHAIEHFGLGRYGDPVDYFGHIKALDNIYKILKKGGKFYFSVPIGEQRIEFNAHRVFSVKYLLGLFADKYEIFSFSYVNDAGNLFENIELDREKIDDNFGCHNGCGIFELIKI